MKSLNNGFCILILFYLSSSQQPLDRSSASSLQILPRIHLHEADEPSHSEQGGAHHILRYAGNKGKAATAFFATQYESLP